MSISGVEISTYACYPRTDRQRLDEEIFSTRKMPTFESPLAPGGSDSMRRLGPNQAFHRYRSSSIHPQSNC